MAALVLGALWALWPVVTLAGGLGFSILTAIAALIAFPGAARSLRPRLYIAAVLAFFMFAGVSALWSPREQVLISLDLGQMQVAVRSEMLRVGLQIVALGVLIAAAQRMSDRAKASIQRIAHIALVLQMALLVVLAAFEQPILQLLTTIVPDTGEGVQNISRNSLIMAAGAVPLAIGLAHGRSPPTGIAILAGVVLTATIILAVREVHAGLLALAAAAASAVLVHILPRHGFKVLGVIIASLLMLAPFGIDALTAGADFATAADSASYRAAIWQRVIEFIEAKPITGNGLGFLRTVRETIETGTFAGQLTVPNHSHNMMLQLWAETGAIGAGLMSLAIVLAGWRMGDARRFGPAGLKAAALVGAMTAVAAVSFDLWNEWWWAVGGLLAILAVVTLPVVQKRTRVAHAEGLTFGASLAADQPVAIPDPVSAQSDAHARNNFNLLRLLFALTVVVYHAIALPSLVGWEQLESWSSLAAELGVQGFFVLSGYLVWASLERSPSIAAYAERRVRRLIPAYVTVILACGAAAFALVPAVRADLGQLASYLGWNLVFLNFMAPSLPGVFESNHFTEINGALWTLKIEVMFYILLPILAYVLRIAGKQRWVLIVLIYVVAETWRAVLEQAGATQGGVMAELSRQLPGQMSFFITGIALCAWRNDINWRSMIAPVGLVLFIASLAIPQAEPVRAAGLGIVAVWAAVGLPRLFDAAAFGDLSYGLYIVHFPIVQILIVAGLFSTTPAFGFAAAAALSLACALLLWWLIERPALRGDSLYRAGR